MLADVAGLLASLFVVNPPAGGLPIAQAVVPALICTPEQTAGLAPTSDHKRVCLIDIGSKNVKLVVASWNQVDPASLRDDRLCRTRLQLGDKTFDQISKTARPLPSDALYGLVRVMKQYQDLCAHDGGEMKGAIATEWARRATNSDAVKATLRGKTGMELQILSGDEEARFGYAAATRGKPKRAVLDLGSRSFQISFTLASGSEPIVVSLPLGTDEAGDRYYASPAFKRFSEAREAHLKDVRAGLDQILVPLLKGLRKRDIEPTLYSLGEDGGFRLALEGSLWDSNGKLVDLETHHTLVRKLQPESVKGYGPVTAQVTPSDLRSLLRKLEKDDVLFQSLRSDPFRKAYGAKVLAEAVLLDELVVKYGFKTVVLVPQEMPDGYLQSRLTPGIHP